MSQTLSSPEPEQLADVETSLYNRMVRNAFFGFVKSAAMGALIGLAVGALIAVPASMGLFHLAFLGANPGLGAMMLAGAMKVGASLGAAAGSFGAVAGIQSTRDTRRFFLMHEAHNLSPEETAEQALVVRRGMPEIKTCCDHSRKVTSQRSQDDASILVR